MLACALVIWEALPWVMQSLWKIPFFKNHPSLGWAVFSAPLFANGLVLMHCATYYMAAHLERASAQRLFTLTSLALGLSLTLFVLGAAHAPNMWLEMQIGLLVYAVVCLTFPYCCWMLSTRHVSRLAKERLLLEKTQSSAP